ncbi:MaoC/PaaZ C-terminal domain-containing protein [Kordiimonas marina]|uniref:MaoC/PaaZ C-terminal domain-containing protein n=1 Tax=Kordiimonas marina TaxID=2872312 RepID=UPI001FF63141|nr:MaoC/PaaZ C-terminal domain-containing protein [Kordiimonas marina]MCJ9430135.1 hypothetical protein [Kordiimonas marina]
MMTDSIRRERTLSQDEFHRFAALSGDDNPIHVNPTFAAGTRFGATVAHGLFLVSILRGLMDELVPGGTQVSQSVMFPAPTYAGAPMVFEAKITGRDHDLVTLAASVRRAEGGTETCLVETTLRQAA